MCGAVELDGVDLQALSKPPRAGDEVLLLLPLADPWGKEVVIDDLLELCNKETPSFALGDEAIRGQECIFSLGRVQDFSSSWRK